jgi:hypothetical protein
MPKKTWTNSSQLRAVLVFSFFGFFLYFFAVRGTYSFYESRKEFGFRGRHSRLMLATIVSALMYALCSVVIIWLSLFGVISSDKSSDMLVEAIIRAIVPYALMGACWGTSLRIWLTFFEVSLAADESDAKWHTLITAPVVYIPRISRASDHHGSTGSDAVQSRRSTRFSVALANASDALLASVHETDESSGSASWYARHKSTYGNRKWLLTRFSLPLFAYYSVIGALGFFGDSVFDMLLYSLINILLVSLMVFLAKNYPSYRDLLMVDKEFRILAKMAVVWVTLYIVVIVYGIATKVDFWWNFWLESMNFTAMILLQTVTTRWVMFKFNSSKNHWLVNDFFQKCENATCSVGCGGETVPALVLKLTKSKSRERFPDDKKKVITVFDVLADERGFHAFMSHLFREFAYENILCIIELMQFRRMVSAFVRGGEDAMDEDGHPFKALRFPEAVTQLKSSIVHHSDLSLEQKFVILVKKYIENNAEMTVNISYRTRDKLVMKAKRLREYNIDEVDDAQVSSVSDMNATLIEANDFDAALIEVIQLLRDSFYRFKTSADFKRLELDSMTV